MHEEDGDEGLIVEFRLKGNKEVGLMKGDGHFFDRTDEGVRCGLIHSPCSRVFRQTSHCRQRGALQEAVQASVDEVAAAALGEVQLPKLKAIDCIPVPVDKQAKLPMFTVKNGTAPIMTSIANDCHLPLDRRPVLPPR